MTEESQRFAPGHAAPTAEARAAREVRLFFADAHVDAVVEDT